MSAGKLDAELRVKLRLVEDDIESLRRSAVQLRQSVGEDQPGDLADRASAIAAAEEQESLAGLGSKARRGELLERLAETG